MSINAVGFALLVLVWLGTVVWAAMFLLIRRMIPYHIEVIGGSETTLPPRVVLFYFAIMRLIGVLGMSNVVLSAYLLFARIQLGDTIAAAVFFASTLLALIMTAATAFHLHRSTGANTPWQPVVVVIAILVLGYVLWLPAGA